MKSAKSVTQIHKLLPGWDVRKSCGVSDWYLMKADSVCLVKHDKRQQGKRSDLDLCVQLIKEGANELALWEANPKCMIRHYRGMRELISSKQQRAKRCAVKVHWFFGVSGAGKTYTAYEEASALYGDSVYHLAADHGVKMWWDGYMNEQAVLIDEFRSQHMTYGEMLKLCDKNGMPLRLPSKGSSKWGNPIKEIWITSFLHPSQMFDAYDFQLERRIDEFREFDAVYMTV